MPKRRPGILLCGLARRSFAEKERLLHLRLQNGSAVLHSGIAILRFSICIGRDEPFGAKPRGAYTPVRGLAGIFYESDLPLHR